MVKKPTEMHAMGFTFDIVYRAAEEYENLGEWDFANKNITINEWYGSLQEKAALMHELIHICSYLGGGKKLKESRVRGLSTQIFTMLRENPKMTAWMLED